MKARNKKTNEIIEVEVYGEINDNGFAYQMPAGKDRWLLFREDELDFDDLTDWSAFRREAAKDLLPLAVQMCDYRGYPEKCVSHAIALADELIKQLKQE